MKEKMLSSLPEEKYDGLLEFIEMYNLTGEKVASLFIDWCGTQVINEDFVTMLEENYGL